MLTLLLSIALTLGTGNPVNIPTCCPFAAVATPPIVQMVHKATTKPMLPLYAGLILFKTKKKVA